MASAVEQRVHLKPKETLQLEDLATIPTTCVYRYHCKGIGGYLLITLIGPSKLTNQQFIAQK